MLPIWAPQTVLWSPRLRFSGGRGRCWQAHCESSEAPGENPPSLINMHDILRSRPVLRRGRNEFVSVAEAALRNRCMSRRCPQGKKERTVQMKVKFIFCNSFGIGGSQCLSVVFILSPLQVSVFAEAFPLLPASSSSDFDTVPTLTQLLRGRANQEQAWVMPLMSPDRWWRALAHRDLTVMNGIDESELCKRNYNGRKRHS